MAVLLAVLGAFLLYPIWLTVQGGFRSRDGQGLTLFHIGQVFADPALRLGLLHAFGIAACVTALTTLIALPLAVLTTRFDFPGKKLLGALILVPMILPPFVGAIGLHFLLGRSGAINALLMQVGVIAQDGPGIDFIGRGGFFAIVLIESLALYPIMYLNATAALANLDPALEEAAENLGASAWRRFRQIVLPLIRPGLFAGGTIVFIWSFTELGTPLMFDFQTITPVQIFNGIKEMETSQTPYALTAVMLVSAILLYAIGKWLLGGRAYAMYSKASIQSSAAPLRGIRGLLVAGLFALVIGVAVLPHISVILVSLSADGSWYRSMLPRALTFEHYGEALAHPLAVGGGHRSCPGPADRLPHRAHEDVGPVAAGCAGDAAAGGAGTGHGVRLRGDDAALALPAMAR
jgi:iron(III) transport system permease protein